MQNFILLLSDDEYASKFNVYLMRKYKMGAI